MAELKNLIVEGDTRLIGDTNAGKITATSIKTSGGTASQFVKGDGTLDSTSYLPTSGGTMSGAITINSNAMGDVPHITFNRANYNYIVIPEGGTLAMGISSSGVGTRLAVDNVAVYPGMNNGTVNLGTTSYPWNNVYADAFIKTGGSASQFLKANGSVDNNAYTPLISTSSTFDFSSTTPVPGIYRVWGITNPVNSQTEYGSVISTQNTGSVGSVTVQMIVAGPASQSNPAHAHLRRLTDGGWTPWSTLLDNNNYTSYLPMIPSTGTSSVVQRGGSNTASGNYSHAEGAYTLAQNQAEHAQGQYNSSHKVNTTFGNASNTIHSIGIGTSPSSRKNAVEVMQNGDVYVIGVGGYTGANYSSANTLQQTIGVSCTIESPQLNTGEFSVDSYSGPDVSEVIFDVEGLRYIFKQSFCHENGGTYQYILFNGSRARLYELFLSTEVDGYWERYRCWEFPSQTNPNGQLIFDYNNEEEPPEPEN